MKRIIYGLAGVMALSGCLAIASPGKSNMYAVQGGEFEINAQQQEKVNYFLVLNVKKTSRATYYIKTEFENPCNHLNPLISESVLAAKEKKVLLRSPALECVKPNRYYKIVISTYDDAAKTHRVDRIVHSVYSLFDSSNLLMNYNKEDLYYAP